MDKESPGDIVFNLSAFRRRAAALAARRNESLVTLSKRLFNGHAWALPRVMEATGKDTERSLPRLDTLLKAEQALADFEAGKDPA